MLLLLYHWDDAGIPLPGLNLSQISALGKNKTIWYEIEFIEKKKMLCENEFFSSHAQKTLTFKTFRMTIRFPPPYNIIITLKSNLEVNVEYVIVS